MTAVRSIKLFKQAQLDLAIAPQGGCGPFAPPSRSLPAFGQRTQHADL